MKNMKTREVPPVPAKTEEFVESYSCDFRCGRTTKNLDNWTTERFARSKVRVEFDSGDSFPEGGSGVVKGYDVCPECFEQVVLPWIKNLTGSAPFEREWCW